MRILSGLRVVELGGVGPVPHAGMMLADLGADVVRVARPGEVTEANAVRRDFTWRGKTVVEADLKQSDDRARILAILEQADIAIEGFRPGTVDRLGVGPAVCQQLNPRLIYAHMTGWGQYGPLTQDAGHDINYLSIAGALFPIGSAGQPVPPLNLVGDYGGGSMFLITGVLAALWERQQSGMGRVVDVAMVDGIAVLSQAILEQRALGRWSDDRSANLLDGGAPFYRTYECRGGGHIAIGAIEPKFYRLVLQGLGLEPQDLPEQYDRSQWPHLSERFAQRIAERTRDEWVDTFAGTDACVTPVLSFEEAATHPHVAARASLRHVDGHVVATGAPRFPSEGS